MSARTKVIELLDNIQASFPEKKTRIEALMRQHGLTGTVKLAIRPPELTESIATFSAEVTRQLSPMLKDRFDYMGCCVCAGERWLAASEVSEWVQKKSVVRYHLTLREHWENSAPMLFPDSRLSLFSVYKGVPDNLVYLVWAEEQAEPELWSYSGMNSNRFANLCEYLEWFLRNE